MMGRLLSTTIIGILFIIAITSNLCASLSSEDNSIEESGEVGKINSWVIQDPKRPAYIIGFLQRPAGMLLMNVDPNETSSTQSSTVTQPAATDSPIIPTSEDQTSTVTTSTSPGSTEDPDVKSPQATESTTVIQTTEIQTTGNPTTSTSENQSTTVDYESAEMTESSPTSNPATTEITTNSTTEKNNVPTTDDASTSIATDLMEANENQSQTTATSTEEQPSTEDFNETQSPIEEPSTTYQPDVTVIYGEENEEENNQSTETIEILDSTTLLVQTDIVTEIPQDGQEIISLITSENQEPLVNIPDVVDIDSNSDQDQENVLIFSETSESPFTNFDATNQITDTTTQQTNVINNDISSFFRRLLSFTDNEEAALLEKADTDNENQAQEGNQLAEDDDSDVSGRQYNRRPRPYPIPYNRQRPIHPYISPNYNMRNDMSVYRVYDYCVTFACKLRKFFGL